MSSVGQVSDEEAYLYGMHLNNSLVLTMVLKSVIELDLLEIIAKAGPGAFMSPTEIASQLRTKNLDAPLMLDRMLRLLASYSILTCSLRTLTNGKVERLYALAPLSKYLTKNEDGFTISAFFLLTNQRAKLESWYYLTDAVLDGGIPFNKAHGMTTYEYHNKDPTFSNLFNNTMSSNSIVIMTKILEIYKGFDGLKSVVDVGGGTGTVLNMIVSKYSSIKAINFDLPHVIEVAPPYPGVEHVSGDMFVSVPKGDAIFMKWICHNWNDEHCLKLLKNCYEALPENGKVIVCECILPVTPDPSLESKLMSSIGQVSDEEAYLYGMHLNNGLVLTMVLKSVIELDLLEIIAKAGPGAFMSPTEIASQLPTKNTDAPLMLDRMLRLLASYSILTCSLRTLTNGKVENLYSLAPLSKYLTKNEDGFTLSAFFLLGPQRANVQSWYYLTDAVLDGGIPFNKAHGMTTYEYHNKDPTFSNLFNNTMSSNSIVIMKKILEIYKGFDGLKSVVDVGGGTGTVPTRLFQNTLQSKPLTLICLM
ncbi:hypothetical protein Ddye_029225 [Dipteronia dyeriana]|uniref:Caffeic acid O-methyltransferase n=1 Tax=Dipteronia dyeriana TaxID=168575 RepID=A0AAD9TF52_9ROSI|nr:hypothetical protein Ddye_029225 [Dipteronia dyeriana]